MKRWHGRIPVLERPLENSLVHLFGVKLLSVLFKKPLKSGYLGTSLFQDPCKLCELTASSVAASLALDLVVQNTWLPPGKVLKKQRHWELVGQQNSGEAGEVCSSVSCFAPCPAGAPHPQGLSQLLTLPASVPR